MDLKMFYFCLSHVLHLNLNFLLLQKTFPVLEDTEAGWVRANLIWLTFVWTTCPYSIEWGHKNEQDLPLRKGLYPLQDVFSSETKGGQTFTEGHGVVPTGFKACTWPQPCRARGALADEYGAGDPCPGLFEVVLGYFIQPLPLESRCWPTPQGLPC